jgi:hypothetical protein
MVNYGICLYYGEGTEINYEKAFLYFDEARSKGSTIGLLYCAICLLHGHGTQSDGQKAFSICKILLNEKYNPAYYLLGLFFIKGSLVVKSVSLAFECFDQVSKDVLLDQTYLANYINDFAHLMLNPTEEKLDEMIIQRAERNLSTKNVIRPHYEIINVQLNFENFVFHDFTVTENDFERTEFLKLSQSFQKSHMI